MYRRPATRESLDQLEAATVDAVTRRKFKELADVDNASLPPYFRK